MDNADMKKLVQIVADVSKLRGIYDEVCEQRDALKAEVERLTLYKGFASALEKEVGSALEIDRDHWRTLALNAKEALVQISKMEGAYSTDHFEHAKNTIRDNQKLALKAISAFPPSEKDPLLRAFEEDGIVEKAGDGEGKRP